MNRPPLPCPACAALIEDNTGHIEQHVTWHEGTKTLGPKHGSYATAAGLRDGFREMRAAVELVTRQADDTPTTRLPPIRETVGVRRRPPVPVVRDLNDRAELLRAMATELAQELQELEDDTTQADDDGRASSCPVWVHGRSCNWPDRSPCLAYGSEGCGMKAQES